MLTQLGTATQVALLVLGVYFLKEGNVLLGLVFATVFVLMTNYRTFSRIGKLTLQLRDEAIAAQCNVVIEIGFDVERALQHQDLNRLFDYLRTPRSTDVKFELAGFTNEPLPPLGASTVGEWRKELVAIYKEKYKREHSFESVRFNVKGSTIFKDDIPWHNDMLIHSLEIPVVSGLDESRYRHSTFKTVEIRVVMINGMLKLQLGRFPKDASPRIYKTSVYPTHRTFVTLTSFPMLHFHRRHGLPEKHLNLEIKGSEAWVAALEDRSDKKRRKSGNDWQLLHDDLVHYRTLVVPDNEDVDYDTRKKAREHLDQRREVFLKEQGFKTAYTQPDEYDAVDLGESHFNDMLHVTFHNLHDWREAVKSEALIDFFEDKSQN